MGLLTYALKVFINKLFQRTIYGKIKKMTNFFKFFIESFLKWMVNLYINRNHVIYICHTKYKLSFFLQYMNPIIVWDSYICHERDDAYVKLLT